MRSRLLLLAIPSLLAAGMTAFLLKALLFASFIGGAHSTLLLTNIFELFSSQILIGLGYLLVAPFVPPFLIGLVWGAIITGGTHLIKEHGKAIANWIKQARPLNLVMACAAFTLAITAGLFLLSFTTGCLLGYAFIIMGAAAMGGHFSTVAFLFLLGVSAAGFASGVYTGQSIANIKDQPWFKSCSDINSDENPEHELASDLACINQPKPEQKPVLNSAQYTRLFEAPDNQEPDNCQKTSPRFGR